MAYPEMRYSDVKGSDMMLILIIQKNRDSILNYIDTRLSLS